LNRGANINAYYGDTLRLAANNGHKDTV